MNLDLRTMLVMIALLTLMLSGLLALAGLHAGTIRGTRQWALASLCISLGMIASINQTLTPTSWALVSGAGLLAAGLGLQYDGIRAFKEERYDRRVILATVGVVFAQTTWFTLIHPDIALRAITNSVVFALMCAACARALLIRIKPPLRTAYWFTGTAFAVFALVFVARAGVIAAAQPGTYGLYSPMVINPVTFFAGSVTQLCLTFGFVLMLNYRLATELQQLAAHDPLTGAFNRRSLEKEGERLLARCARTGDTLAVMMLDVDHFKSINDRFGHMVGDEVLVRLVQLAQGSIRTADYFTRYGGEEFCILLPSSTESDVMGLAERLRQHYAELAMEFGDEILHSTISIGVADSNHTGLELPALLAAADQALYCAKHEGRNRVVGFSRMERAV